jgi:hypothetical protein
MEKTFLFIHVPKTGGMAIEAYFRAIGLVGFFDPLSYMPVRSYLKVPPTHYDYRLLEQVYNLDRLFSFAVVRHPVQRMVSNYKWLIEKSTAPPTISKIGFADYLDFIFDQYAHDENVSSGHIKPQTRFVGGRVSRVFRYEDGLENAISEVLRHLGLELDRDVRLPVINNTAAKEIEPSQKDVERIYEFYKEDFLAFDYKV